MNHYSVDTLYSNDIWKKTAYYPHGKLCICSVQSQESGFKDYEFIASVAGKSLGFEPVVQSDETTREDVMLCLNFDYPVMILLVGSTDNESISMEIKAALKNYVPILVFIKDKNRSIIENSKSIVRKYLSEAYYDYECTAFSNCEDLYEKIGARLRAHIKEKKERHVTLQSGVALAYRRNADLMNKARKLIIIYQMTSIMLLGPRNGCTYEEQYYDRLMQWLRDRQENEPACIHVFNWEETVVEKKELAHKYNLQLAKSNLLDLYNRGIISGANIRISHTAKIVPYIITDTNLVFIVPIEGRRFSIDLPSHILKEQEVNLIQEEMIKDTLPLEMKDILEFYK